MRDQRFLITERMPCEPGELHIRRYLFPELFDDPETEEAVARLLTLVQVHEEWTGVTREEVIQQMRSDSDLRTHNESIDRANAAQLEEYNSEFRWYVFYCIITFSYWYFTTTAPDRPEPAAHKPEPETLLYTGHGTEALDGLNRLVSQELLRSETVGEGRDQRTVYYPTAQLIQMILDYQQKQEASTRTA